MRDGDETAAAAALLRWYERHARVLPWRVGPTERAQGVRPDPYRVWLSEIMLQQTTVATVRAYFHRFTTLWPTVDALAHAPEAQVMAEWAGLGYYARARNLVACSKVIAFEHGGHFPQNLAGLSDLPGIGPYTAAAIASIAFDQRSVVVDGNVERVVSRLWAVAEPLPKARATLNAKADLLTPRVRTGDHAQAMMDLGATICTPRQPACHLCPVQGFCAATALADPAIFPVKLQKPPKPIRTGIVWVARRHDGAFVIEDRPKSGLLGGMIGFPGTGWDGSGDDHPPIKADWADAGQFRHTFTHFHLDLRVQTAQTDGAPDRGRWAHISETDLPTLMRKAHNAALSASSMTS